MTHRWIRKNILIAFSVAIFLSVPVNFASADGSITFGPEETNINGLIKYSVIGKYNAEFEEFEGKIDIDQTTNEIKSVYLQIKAATIKSNCGWCDKIVISKRLLDTEKHPDITFQSNSIFKDEEGYNVKGILSMHGVEKEVTFPFDLNTTLENDNVVFDIKGRWFIDRKDFDIVWNKLLDKGGVLVGNTITVEWGIKSDITVL